ncbi:hypothetical protein C8A03DRAFT_30679 [Achaetomium macrosporum]|uniref:Uncharacterized protein n=1 Tax=Achaetomium macrosporum TaxID=79813 RepID=A0AAN7CGI0_9PEZI|nr:hypothetical protein C8A03DRAFT_30679 [Achaetomium macrosporum]
MAGALRNVVVVVGSPPPGNLRISFQQHKFADPQYRHLFAVGDALTERLSVAPTRNVIFRSPDIAAGNTEPFINLKKDGREDMGVEGVWAICDVER